MKTLSEILRQPGLQVFQSGPDGGSGTIPLLNTSGKRNKRCVVVWSNGGGANKRLCSRASAKTRHVVRLMCDEAVKATPELERWMVPMCMYHGGVCHEINGCGRCIQG